MLARSNLIYAVIYHRRGNREGAVGQLAPNFGAVRLVCTVHTCGRYPQTVSPNREVSYFLYFRFVFICEKAKG